MFSFLKRLFGWDDNREVRDLALLALRFQTDLAGAAHAPPEALLGLLRNTDALRRGERFAELLGAFQLAGAGAASTQAAQRLRRALEAAGAIDAGGVARAAGSPAEIPARIEAARLEAVRAALG